jgi:hypothetical protein
MSNETLIRLVDLAQAKFDELFEEIKAELLDRDTRVAGTDRTGELLAGPDVWSLDSIALAGEWEPLGSGEAGQTYTWPDGNVDTYSDFVKYRGRDEFEAMNLGLGYLPSGDVVGFVLGAQGGSKRGITYFFPADDFAETNEKISMIRGGGPNGRSGFAPDEPKPPAYAGFETAILHDRKAGKWRVLGVVVDADDVETMLRHTAIQARLRGLA